MLTAIFDQARTIDIAPIERLKHALAAFIQYGRDYPARYQLLFSDPDIGAAEGPLEVAALGVFMAFVRLVQDCHETGNLPRASTRELAGLIYATAHGLIDLQAGGRMREQKGLSAAEQGVSLLLSLLGAPQPR